jgi:hypothetical protein
MNTAQEISERIEGLADELRSDRLEVDRIFDDAMKACGSAISIHAKTATTPPSSTSFSARYEALARIRTIIQTLPDGLNMKHLERLVAELDGIVAGDRHAEARSLRLCTTAALHIRPRDPSLLPELARHFERSGFRVERVGDAVDVRRLDAPDDEQATRGTNRAFLDLREILLHLRVWLVMHPGSIEKPTSDQ